jgi:hypothetical protein
MNPQQTMGTQATLSATFARFMDGSPSERVAVAGIICIGTGILRLRNIASHVVEGWSD